MTVQELIEALQTLDPGQRVVVAGYEDGFNDISEIKTCTLRLNVYQEWYYGSHADAEKNSVGENLPNAELVEAVVLLGKNTNSKA